MATLITKWFGVFLCEENRILAKRLMPKDSDEIWGIVANATGLGEDASATISRVTPTLDPAAGTMFPAAGSVANVLSNGKVLGAFDVTLYNGGERVTSFSGMYCI